MKLYLNKIRTERNMSIRDLAEKSGVAKSHIEKMEANDANPSMDIICKLAKALGVPAHKLFSCD